MSYTGFSLFREPKAKRPSDACKYNNHVVCPKHDKCRKCGWNPKVAERRLDLFFERIMTEEPELYARLIGEK